MGVTQNEWSIVIKQNQKDGRNNSPWMVTKKESTKKGHTRSASLPSGEWRAGSSQTPPSDDVTGSVRLLARELQDRRSGSESRPPAAK